MIWEPEEFQPFGKIARFSRGCTITEKIDGTNAQVYISDDLGPFRLKSGNEVPFMCASRTRYIFPEQDNMGFAKWAYAHQEAILALGPGRHYGEWWGAGIQRRYGLTEKRFSLFNSQRWQPGRDALPEGIHVVPILYEGLFNEAAVEGAIKLLTEEGSKAAPGFNSPEGIVIYHHALRQYFKKTLVGDEKPKGSKEE